MNDCFNCKSNDECEWKSSILKTVEKNFRSIIDESKDILLDDETCKTMIEEEEKQKESEERTQNKQFANILDELHLH